jgi:hypothetical protein
MALHLDFSEPTRTPMLGRRTPWGSLVLCDPAMVLGHQAQELFERIRTCATPCITGGHIIRTAEIEGEVLAMNETLLDIGLTPIGITSWSYELLKARHQGGA